MTSLVSIFSQVQLAEQINAVPGSADCRVIDRRQSIRMNLSHASGAIDNNTFSSPSSFISFSHSPDRPRPRSTPHHSPLHSTVTRTHMFSSSGMRCEPPHAHGQTERERGIRVVDPSCCLYLFIRTELAAIIVGVDDAFVLHLDYIHLYEADCALIPVSIPILCHLILPGTKANFALPL